MLKTSNKYCWIARNRGFKSDHYRTFILNSFTSIPDSKPVNSNPKNVSARSIITVEVFKCHGVLKRKLLNFSRDKIKKKLFSNLRIFVRTKLRPVLRKIFSSFNFHTIFVIVSSILSKVMINLFAE